MMADDRQEQRVPSAGQTTPEQRVRRGKKRGKQDDNKMEQWGMDGKQNEAELGKPVDTFIIIFLYEHGQPDDSRTRERVC